MTGNGLVVHGKCQNADGCSFEMMTSGDNKVGVCYVFRSDMKLRGRI